MGREKCSRRGRIYHRLTIVTRDTLLIESAILSFPLHPLRPHNARTRARAEHIVVDHAGSFGPCDDASETCCLPHSKRRRHPGIGFRGSMAGLCPPLPTLRRRPRGHQRTARGRCRSLLLHRSGLAPPTPCRSPGALRVLHAQPGSAQKAHFCDPPANMRLRDYALLRTAK
jgi:hypothetical protein